MTDAGDESKGSFSQGVGEWIGSAEVYGAAGRFAGHGRDTRSVRADDGAGRVTVDVSFDGPFSMAGTYTIADHGTHRVYEGPLNIGYAEVLSDGLIAAHNYWADLGFTQRFFLMVLPDGDRQMSLALLSRGEQLRWAVVGEYRRQTDPDQPQPPAVTPIDVGVVADDPHAGRGEALLARRGTWRGEMTVLDPQRSADTAEKRQLTEVQEVNGDTITIATSGGRSGGDAPLVLQTDGWSFWTGPGEVVGGGTMFGGRGSSAQFHRPAAGRRLWRREVASLDGTCKAVVNAWYTGEVLTAWSHGVLTFEPS